MSALELLLQVKLGLTELRTIFVDSQLKMAQARVSPATISNLSVLHPRFTSVASAVAYNERLKASSRKFDNEVRPFQVHVEGNIACGKTSLLGSLEGNSDISLQYEPVEEWVYENLQEGTPNLLAAFYKDPKANAAPLQRLVLTTYHTLHDVPCTTPIKVWDRSLHSSEIFRNVLLEDGWLGSKDYEDLQFYYEALNSSCDSGADLVIYLRTNPALCFRRLVTRDRPEERGVTLQYLTKLHHAHENWIAQCPFRVITLDGEAPKPVVKDRAIRIIYREFSETRIRAFTRPYESTRHAPFAALSPAHATTSLPDFPTATTTQSPESWPKAD